MAQVDVEPAEQALLQLAGAEPLADPSSCCEFAVYIDGGGLGNPGPAAVAAVVVNPNGEIVLEQAREIGDGTNNVAEYKALLFGISLARLVGCKTPHFVSDSMLVVNQISNWWAIRDAELSRLHGFCSSRLMEFDEWSIQHVAREKNKRADWLVNKLIRGVEHSRTLKKPPVGIEFRTGRRRPGWVNLGKPGYET
jgi:ribonuclease HI